MQEIPEMRVSSLGQKDVLENEMTGESCLKNPMGKGAWRTTVHGVTKSQTRLKWLSMSHRTAKLLLLPPCWLKEAIAKPVPITLQQRLCLREEDKNPLSLCERNLCHFIPFSLFETCMPTHSFVTLSSSGVSGQHITLSWRMSIFYSIAASHVFGYALWKVLKCALSFRASQPISPNVEQSLSLVDVHKLLCIHSASYHIFNACSSMPSMGLHLNLIFFLKNNFTICIYLSI